jgi:hypothetical protein
MRVTQSISIALITATMLGACSHTDLVELWRDADASATPMDNILVIALDRNAEMRRFWEDALCAEFQAHGLLARPSYQLFPASLPDSQQVGVVMRRDKHDGALVTHRLSVVTDAGLEGGYRENAPAGRTDYWRSAYNTHYVAANLPVTESKDKEASYRIDLARADGRLMWTGTTKAIDPKSAEKLRTEVAGQVVPELERRGVIPKKD